MKNFFTLILTGLLTFPFASFAGDAKSVKVSCKDLLGEYITVISDMSSTLTLMSIVAADLTPAERQKIGINKTADELKKEHTELLNQATEMGPKVDACVKED